MKIGIIGLGVVGSAVQHGLTRIGHDVRGYDLKRPETSRADVADAELIFVCVPTPSLADGSCDTSIVEHVVAELHDSAESFDQLVVIKSTVPPGTTDRLAARYPRLRLAFCPEFLRERAAVVDFVEHHDVCIVGTRSLDDFRIIEAAHGTLPRHVVQLLPVEAELAKYYGNVFNALRVVFANGFYEIAQRLGADYGAIKAAMVKRDNIADAYLDCSPRYRGFGGVCLPKDTAALAALAHALGVELELFDAIVADNKRFATTVPKGMRP